MITFCSHHIKPFGISKYMFKSEKANMSKLYSCLTVIFSNDHLDTVAPERSAQET